MGISLFGLTPAATYPALIKFGDNSAISGVLRALSDGLGNDLPIQVSNTAVNFTGTASIGGTAIVTNASGIAGAIQFSNGSAFASDASNLFWDDTNNRLGVGTNVPSRTLTVTGDGARIKDLNIGVSASTTIGNTSNIIANWGSNGIGVRSGGVLTASAIFHIQGSGSTSATTSLLVQNSAGTNALQVRDDLRVIVPSVFETGEANGFTFNSNTITTKINGFLALDRTSNRQFRIVDTSSTLNYLIVQTSSSSNFADISFNTDHLAIKKEGNIGIGTSTPSAKTHIKGSGTTSATTSLLVQNSAGTAAMTVKDDLSTSVKTLYIDNSIEGATSGRMNIISQYDLAIRPNTGGVGFAEGFGFSVNGSALIEMQSTTKGFLPPRMTTTQKNAIATPAAGLQVFDTTFNQMSYFNGSVWINF